MWITHEPRRRRRWRPATATGFEVETKAAPYAENARRVNSSAAFDGFVASLQAGRVAPNVHANRFTDGEISGDVVPAA